MRVVSSISPVVELGGYTNATNDFLTRWIFKLEEPGIYSDTTRLVLGLTITGYRTIGVVMGGKSVPMHWYLMSNRWSIVDLV